MQSIDNSTPLCDACAGGSIDCVKILLEAGAWVNPPLLLSTPLHEASLRGSKFYFKRMYYLFLKLLKPVSVCIGVFCYIIRFLLFLKTIVYPLSRNTLQVEGCNLIGLLSPSAFSSIFYTRILANKGFTVSCLKVKNNDFNVTNILKNFIRCIVSNRHSCFFYVQTNIAPNEGLK